MMSSYVASQQKGQQSGVNIEVLSYCYSAIITTLDFGVIANQEAKILETCNYLLRN
jgi:hypothetical protein